MARGRQFFPQGPKGRRFLALVLFLVTAYGCAPADSGLAPGGQSSLAAEPSKKWNVLFIIMESTGAEYIFETRHGNAVPMPFLKGIAEQSLLARRHFSSTNTTPRGSFSILSGLYPSPTAAMYIMRRDVRLPSIKNYLSGDYRYLYVYNGPQSWFFPRYFYQNNNFPVIGKDELPAGNWGPAPKLGVHEAKLTDFFIKKLPGLGEPFVAVYHSFISHWPYYDYGPRYDVFGKSKPNISRFERGYLNNLRMMDTLIERMFDHLRRSGQLERTIVVITGDHGEAFGRPKGNWVHSRASYNVNYHVPLIIYQPKLFRPRVEQRLTQHPDILPTLLEAMGVRTAAGRFQGESLFSTRFRRRYAFLYGNEKTLTSISSQNIKLQKKLGRCWAFDLNSDPEESRKLNCESHRQQHADLESYRRYQPDMLRSFNKAQTADLGYTIVHPPWWTTDETANRN